MAWTKDAISQSPKTVYTPPQDKYPLVKVTYDPNAVNKWLFEYEYLQEENETQATIEEIMEL